MLLRTLAKDGERVGNLQGVTGADPGFWEGRVTALGAACKKHTHAKLERYLFKLVFSKLYQTLFHIKYGAKVRFWV